MIIILKIPQTPKENVFLPMSSIFLEKDADTIYEDYQNISEETFEQQQQEEEYREDRMEQMISRYGY